MVESVNGLLTLGMINEIEVIGPITTNRFLLELKGNINKELSLSGIINKEKELLGSVTCSKS